MTGARHRDRLPQLEDWLLITDGGLETTLIFHEGIDLPLFAAFVLLADDEGTATLRRYYERYLAIARRHALGILLESATWRASPGWAARLGYAEAELAELNRKAIRLLADLRDEHADVEPAVISGCVGPEGDGYAPASTLTPEQAERYHTPQIEAFADAEADLVTAITMTYAEEAIGIARAAHAAGLPVAISFTLETDGRLPSGETLAAAIARVDGETGSAPAYYMINCAHPSHFAHVVAEQAPWLERVRGLRANASRLSHAELDEAEELDEGDPDELAAEYRNLARTLRRLAVLGGCCGTDHRHVEAIAAAWTRR